MNRATEYWKSLGNNTSCQVVTGDACSVAYPPTKFLILGNLALTSTWMAQNLTFIELLLLIQAQEEQPVLSEITWAL